MKFRLYILFACVFGVVMPGIGNADKIKVGAAEVIITPPKGTPMGGYFSPRDVHTVHDDLFSRSIVLESEGTKVAIVVCDLVSMPDIYINKAREIVKNELGIASENNMVGATHSHTGPVILREEVEESLSSNADQSTERGRILKQYLKDLPEMIAESISKANANLQPASLSFAKEEEHGISFNRRYFMTDGSVGWNPGVNNEKVIRPAGPIDPEVMILYAEDTQEGVPIANFVNFALHLDQVGGEEVSADMPYVLADVLKTVRGADSVMIFSQGCSGNINHLDVNWKRSDDPKYKKSQSGIFKAEESGGILAGQVIKGYEKLTKLDVTAIQVKNEIIDLPSPKFTKEDLEWAEETIDLHENENQGQFLDYVKAYKIRDVYPLDGGDRPVEISMFAFGEDLAVIRIPFEVFTELGMYIKERSPYKYTIIQELTNSSNGYLPNMMGYMEGNYEPVTSRVAPGSGDILVKNIMRMLFEMKNS